MPINKKTIKIRTKTRSANELKKHCVTRSQASDAFLLKTEKEKK